MSVTKLHHLKLDGNNIAIFYAFTPGTLGLIDNGTTEIESETAMVDIIEVKLNGVVMDVSAFDLSVLEYIVYEFHMHNEATNNDIQIPLFDVEMLEENISTLKVYPDDYAFSPITVKYKIVDNTVDILEVSDEDGIMDFSHLSIEDTAEMNYCYASAVKAAIDSENKNDAFKDAFHAARNLYHAPVDKQCLEQI